MWNLWLMDLETGAARRIADVPCNQMEPSWESDSKTLLYGTDCGRSVWVYGCGAAQCIAVAVRLILCSEDVQVRMGSYVWGGSL